MTVSGRCCAGHLRPIQARYELHRPQAHLTSLARGAETDQRGLATVALRQDLVMADVPCAVACSGELGTEATKLVAPTVFTRLKERKTINVEQRGAPQCPSHGGPKRRAELRAWRGGEQSLSLYLGPGRLS
jgi:hypothetical protein